MRTRTLMLLAVACGLLILVAGGVQLLRVANQDDPPRAVAIGETVRVGDMEIVVQGFGERAGSVLVDVELGGVDDPDGAGGFRLVGARRGPRGGPRRRQPLRCHHDARRAVHARLPAR